MAISKILEERKGGEKEEQERNRKKKLDLLSTVVTKHYNTQQDHNWSTDVAIAICSVLLVLIGMHEVVFFSCV